MLRIWDIAPGLLQTHNVLESFCYIPPSYVRQSCPTNHTCAHTLLPTTPLLPPFWPHHWQKATPRIKATTRTGILADDISKYQVRYRLRNPTINGSTNHVGQCNWEHQVTLIYILTDRTRVILCILLLLIRPGCYRYYWVTASLGTRTVDTWFSF